MRKPTLEAVLDALLHGIESPSRPAAPAARFAGALVRGKDPQPGGIPRYPLRSIFTHLNGEHPGLSLPLAVQDGRLHLPDPRIQSISPDAYHAVMAKLRTELAALDRDEASIPGLLRLLEDCLSFLPADPTDPEGDISLYDRNRITAAIAACVSEYLPDGEAMDNTKQAFLLYSADFSGIQKFIFTVANKGALASLRSRSIFLELLMEHYIDELLSACTMSRVNLLYSGGGHCYLLLPNTPKVDNALKVWNTRFNDWLLDQFGSGLFIAHGWTACCGNDLINHPAARSPYTAMFRSVSSAISAHKLHRYSADQLRRVNAEAADPEGRECVVCGRSDRLNADGRCVWCGLFVELSRKILDCSVYLVSDEYWNADFSLPGWEGEKYFSLTNEKTACARLNNGEAVTRIYTKNQVFPGLETAIRLYVGDYAASREMAALAQNAQGISRLAVCRMDVDNLGHAFVAGYRIPGETDPELRDRYLDIARTSAFSRQMSLFFKWYINPILEEPEPDGHRLSVAVVYSGGDDVFLVGAWNDVITAVQRIQTAFDAFCGGSLTISAGISLHDDHFPIRQAAAYSAQLEDRAKQMPGKNALALFDPEADHTYSWQEFREKVLGEKLKALDDFFGEEDQERGNSFLYQLLELLRQARTDRINLARYAYLLAKMEPREWEKKESYRVFSQSMYRWGLSGQDRRQLITAICLFVYKGRRKEK